MKPTPFNHIFLIEYIITPFKITTPLLVGVALGGVALTCSVHHLSISAIYEPIWMKPKPFNHIFLTEYIITTFKSATPLLVGVALGGVALNRVFSIGGGGVGIHP